MAWFEEYEACARRGARMETVRVRPFPSARPKPEGPPQYELIQQQARARREQAAAAAASRRCWWQRWIGGAR